MRTLLALSALLGILGCTSDRQVDAVNAAKVASCNRYQACGRIGAGETYATRADCDANVQDFWNDLWPAAQCDGHIDPRALDTCIDRIGSTDCDNFLDQLNTIVVSCAQSDVCSAR